MKYVREVGDEKKKSKLFVQSPTEIEPCGKVICLKMRKPRVQNDRMQKYFREVRRK